MILSAPAIDTDICRNTPSVHMHGDSVLQGYSHFSKKRAQHWFLKLKKYSESTIDYNKLKKNHVIGRNDAISKINNVLRGKINVLVLQKKNSRQTSLSYNILYGIINYMITTYNLYRIDDYFLRLWSLDTVYNKFVYNQILRIRYRQTVFSYVCLYSYYIIYRDRMAAWGPHTQCFLAYFYPFFECYFFTSS